MTKRERETAKRRELGLCLSCGKPSAPKATCPDCGQRANAAHAKARASKRGGFDGTVSVRVD